MIIHLPYYTIMLYVYHYYSYISIVIIILLTKRGHAHSVRRAAHQELLPRHLRLQGRVEDGGIYIYIYVERERERDGYRYR